MKKPIETFKTVIKAYNKIWNDVTIIEKQRLAKMYRP